MSHSATASSEPLIVSVSGLRGIVGATLTPEVAARYAVAFVETLPPGPLVLGRDGRESGPMLAAAISAAVVARGRDVIDCGVAATPTIGIAVKDRGAAGGIQISASHNPARYNGMKLFAGAGRVLTAAAGREVLAGYERLAASGGMPPTVATAGSVVAFDPTELHVALVERAVDAPAIRRLRPRVWIDCGHGAGSRVALPLLERLGCEVIAVGDTADGRFEHEPEPTAENLADLLPTIREAGADIGFFQDPDADRLAIADASGRYLGEEATLALCVEAVLAGRPGPLVVNCSTSGMTAAIAARHGVPCEVSAVGEANVVDRMLETGAVLGGEGNGGVIDPRVVLVRDSAVAMGLVLARMCGGDRMHPVAELAATLPAFVMKKTKLPLSPAISGAGLAAALDRIAAAFPAADANRLDGLRLDWPGGWLLVRGSNTEPIVRIVGEQAIGAGGDTAAAAILDAAIARAAAALDG
jgi:phosphomannomutase